MEYHILNDTFQKTALVENFSELLWVERFNEPGSVSIKMAATEANRLKYPLGTKIERDQSLEVVLISQREIENGILTLTGRSLLDVLSRRMCAPTESTYGIDLEYGLTYEMPADQFADHVFTLAVADGGGAGNPIIESMFTIAGLDKKPSLGTPSWVGPVIPVTIARDTDYLSTLLGPARDANMGVTIAKQSDSSSDLYYNAYFGVDRSADVVFSELDGQLTSVKTLETDTQPGFIFVYVPEMILDNDDTGYYGMDETGANKANGPDNPLGLYKSSVVVPVTDIIDPSLLTYSELQLILKARARAELMARQPVSLADGEILPNSNFEFGVDYNLGDIVGLESLEGITSTARITEYIWASDNTGHREYPTIAILD